MSFGVFAELRFLSLLFAAHRVRLILQQWLTGSQTPSITRDKFGFGPSPSPIAPTDRMNKVTSLITKAAVSLPAFIKRIHATRNQLGMAGTSGTEDFPPLPVPAPGHFPTLAAAASATKQVW